MGGGGRRKGGGKEKGGEGKGGGGKEKGGGGKKGEGVCVCDECSRGKMENLWEGLKVMVAGIGSW